MPEPLESDVQLDIGDALGRIEEIRSALEAAVSGVPVVPLEADTAAIPPAIESAIDTGSSDPAEILAETGAIPPDIEAAIAAADPSVPLEVDASGAEQAEQATRVIRENLEDANEQAEFLGLSFDQIKQGAAAFGLALGAKQALGFIRDAVNAASDEVETLNKAREVFGRLTPEVIKFGETSAEAVGLGDDAAIEYAATLGNLFTSMGLTRRGAADMSLSVVQLGADFASFMNIPVEDAINRIRAGLIGQVRPLRQLGISYNETEVAAKAVTLGLAEQGEELSEVDKIQARYAIIVDKSKNAQGDFARTSDELANSQRILKAEVADATDELGAHLLPGMKELVATARSDFVPALTEVADPLFRIVAAALEAGTATGGVLTGGLRAVTPLLEVTATVLESIPPDVLAMAANVFLLSRATSTLFATTNPVLALLLQLAPLLGALPGGIGSAAASIGLAAVAGGRLAGVLPNVSKGAGAAALGVAALGAQIGGAEGKAISLGATGALIGTQIAPGIGTAVGAVAGLVAGFLTGGESAEEMRERVAALSKELEGLGAQGAAKSFLESGDLLVQEFDALTGATGEFSLNVEDARTQLRTLAEDSPAAAERVLEGMRRLVAEGTITQQQFELLARAVDRGTESYGKHNERQREATETNADYASEATKAAEAEQKAAAALDAFVDAAVSGLPTADAVLDQTASALSDFGLALDNAVSPEQFLQRLEETTQGIINFQSNVQTLIDQGFTNIASLVVSKGPEVGGAFAQALLSGDEATRIALESQLGLYQGAVDTYEAFLRGPGAAQLAEGFKAATGPAAAQGAAIFGQEARRVIGAETPATVLKARGVGLASGLQLGRGAQATAPPEVARALALARQLGFGGAALSGLIAAAAAAGRGVGFAFGRAIESGIRSAEIGIDDAARDVVRSARDAAANAGSPSEHLFYDVAALWPAAMENALRAGEHGVVAAAEAITRAAAGGLPLPQGGIGTGGSGGGLTLNVDQVLIEVSGVSDPGTAESVGRAAARGFADELDGATRRRLLTSARIGG